MPSRLNLRDKMPPLAPHAKVPSALERPGKKAHNCTRRAKVRRAGQTPSARNRRRHRHHPTRRGNTRSKGRLSQALTTDALSQHVNNIMELLTMAKELADEAVSRAPRMPRSSLETRRKTLNRTTTS